MSLGSIGFSLLCVAWCSCAAVSSNNGSASQILTTVFVNTNGGMAQVPTVVSVTNNTVSQIPIVVTGNHTSGTVHQSPSAYMSIIQNFLQSTKFGKQIQQEISTFLQASNVTLPLPIMNQANLLKVIGNFLPKLGSNGTLSLKDLLTNNGSDSLQHLLENLGKMGTSSLYHSLQASVGAVLGRLSLQCMGHLTQLTGDTKTALSSKYKYKDFCPSSASSSLMKVFLIFVGKVVSFPPLKPSDLKYYIFLLTNHSEIPGIFGIVTHFYISIFI